MTGGAFGSLFAQFFNLSSAERKILLVAGAAGGMSAIFAAPIAAVLLAVELLLFEWRPRSFIPVSLSAAATKFHSGLPLGCRGRRCVSRFSDRALFFLSRPTLLWAVRNWASSSWSGDRRLGRLRVDVPGLRL